MEQHKFQMDGIANKSTRYFNLKLLFDEFEILDLHVD